MFGSELVHKAKHLFLDLHWTAKKECVGLLLLGMGRQKVSYEGGPLLIRSVIYVHVFYCLLFRRFIFSKHHISYLGVLWLDQGLWDGPGLVCRIEFIVYV